MKAIGYQRSLSINQVGSLLDIELPKPEASGKDLLVKVEAISVNPVDTKVRMRVEPQEGQLKVLGWDGVGIVEQVGNECSDFKIGDRVWYAGDLTRSGSNAEFQLVDERIVSKAPSTLSSAEAAALPLTTLTAWEMLFDRLEVDATEKKTILIIGAAGGVGSIMVQLARILTNLNIIATASRPETTVWLKELGADQVINHRNPLSEEIAKENCIDYVVSLNCTDQHMPEVVKVLKPQGKFGLIDDPQELNILPLKQKSISLHWEFMYTRSMFETEDMIEQQRILGAVAGMIDEGQIKTTVSEQFGLINAANLRRAHELLESQKTKGKIVLEGF
ncbi:zinc-binding alcohol dehydrogenase family protein [Vibrio pelagius]|uniref:zinc-binding alcohol dehydrogenase family protein n=1 Tax=Vibrio pelagius TaxID=28169 RepID=UPI003554486C